MRGVHFAVLALIMAVAQAGGQTPSAAQRVPDSARRARLEGDVRRSFAQLVRERVGLSDDQMRRLAPLARVHDQQRRELQVEERRTRASLRDFLRQAKTADSARVSGLLLTLVDIQKRRVALVEVEQRDLATIMTPFQRARYAALQEQVRRRLEQMRHRRGSP
jgi:Spy/CpxP family protein refolding chaperone